MYNMGNKLIRNRILISITIIIIFIVIWFVLSLTNNLITNKQTFPQISGNLSSEAICSDEKTGWSCEFNINRSEMKNLRGIEMPILEVYKNKCEEMGGQWNCYGYCMPEYTHYCDFRYKDGGDLCISSLQCGDKCTGIFGVGKCSEYQVRVCDQYNEIFFGIPIPHMVLCD